MPGNDRNARGLHRLTGARLRAHQLDRVGRRPDPGEAGGLDRSRKRRVLGQEAVARVHRAGAGALRGVDDRLDLEIALGRRRRPDQIRLVRVGDVQRGAIGLRIDGDRAEPELSEGAEDADRDLAAVGDQNLVEHE